jgi:hypothetical protein
MKKLNMILIAMLLGVTLPFALQAQCKGFVKKTCLPKLKPYTINGQVSSAVMSAGESADLQMTFYSGQEYRIIVCSQEVLGKVGFKVLDSGKNEIFNSNENDDPSTWDFKVKSTQQLIIEIVVPALSSPNSLVPTGCVSVLVGFKK